MPAVDDDDDEDDEEPFGPNVSPLAVVINDV